MIKILNLYACLGGNRLLWDNCIVTAVELDRDFVELYKKRFPNDTVIIGDAHKYLLNNYKNFDFIWSSPPCTSHSIARYARSKNVKPLYPDLKLYEEIIFLKSYFNGLYCVENVIPYYDPLIKGNKRGRHIYWTNFYLPNILSTRKTVNMKAKNEFKKLIDFHNYDFNLYKGNKHKQSIARSLVDYEARKTIFDSALNIMNKKELKQLELF